MPPRRIILVHKRAPGDTVVLTGLIRDIALSRPGQFELDVDVNAPDIIRHNPYLTPLKQLSPQKGIEYITADYGKGIRDQASEMIHFLAYFHRDFAKKTGVAIPLMRPYPDLHLSPEERNVSPIEGRYWVIVTGGKSDLTTKVWGHKAWYETIHHLRRWGLQFVQIGGTDKGHWHPLMPGTLNLIGQTNLRDVMRLIHHADGVICGNTMCMHMAAALQRPCVVLGGGREAYWWAAYVRENAGLGGLVTASQLVVPHRFLHTIGQLDCAKVGGCWRNKTVPLNGDKNLCYKPILRPGQAVPACLDMITPAMVSQAVMSYYLDGTLQPVPGTPLEQEVRHLQGSLPCQTVSPPVTLPSGPTSAIAAATEP